MLNTFLMILFTVFILVPTILMFVMLLFLGLESAHYGLSKKFPFKGFKHFVDNAHVSIKEYLETHYSDLKIHH